MQPPNSAQDANFPHLPLESWVWGVDPNDGDLFFSELCHIASFGPFLAGVEGRAKTPKFVGRKNIIIHIPPPSYRQIYPNPIISHEKQHTG